MAFAWQILVTAKDGTPKPTINSADGVASIDSLSLDGIGSCLEAELTALPSAVDLEPRDLIEIQYSDDDGATWVAAIYTGVITSAPSAEGNQLSAFRAIGLKQRLYERIMTKPLASADAATMANLAINEALALGVLGLDLPFGGFPPLGFTIGARAPNLETIGDTLDALAATVGSFTVPTGETYTYDGRTWTEGEVVPAVRWGVDAAGRGFFGRPTGEPLAFFESNRRVDVEWAAISAEQVNDRTTLVYASALAPGGVLRLGDEEDPDQAVVPMFAQAGTGDYEADRVVVLEGPLDFAEDTPAVQTWGGSITNPLNAFDGDPLTFATFAGSGDFLQVSGTGKGVGIARIRLRINAQTIGISSTATPPNVEIGISYRQALTQIANLTYLIQPTTTAAERTLILPVLLPASLEALVTATRVTVNGASGVRCYALELYTPIAADVTRLAEAFESLPEPAVAAIAYRGLLAPTSVFDTSTLRPTAVVTALSGATVEANVERQEISITPDEGVTTRIYVGQAFDAEDAALSIVLERLARRAVAEGGARA